MTSSKSAAARKRRITLAQLSAYDDILTDTLVDHVYYWTTVPKNRPSYHPSRGVREDEVAKIIQEEVVVRKDLGAGERRLLASDGLRRFGSALRTDKERDDFHSHLRRYLRMYLPDCPWEVSSTNRYTIVTHEACVTARRHIRKNETIKYLSGIQVVITPDEEKEIASRKKDFSIVVSSRNKCTSLFMGPARFANHDCQANAKLITTSHSEIEIVASRPIDVGEEITVTYGDSYFGEDNCECLCLTCEKQLRNGWEPAGEPLGGDGAAAAGSAGHLDKSESYSLRRRRREDSIASSRTPSVTPDVRPRVFKTKAKTKLAANTSSSAATEPQSLRAASSTPEVSTAATLGAAATATTTTSPSSAFQTSQKRNGDHMATPPITPAKKAKQLPKGPMACRSSMPSSNMPSAGHTASRDSSVTTESNSHSGNAQEETDATSPEKESPEPSELPMKTMMTTTIMTTTTNASAAAAATILATSAMVKEISADDAQRPADSSLADLAPPYPPPSVSTSKDLAPKNSTPNYDPPANTTTPGNPQRADDLTPRSLPSAENSSSRAVEPFSPQSLNGQISPPIPILPKGAAAAAATAPALPLSLPLALPLPVPLPIPLDAAAITRSAMSLANILNGPFQQRRREPEAAAVMTITPSIEVIEKDREIIPEPPRVTRKYQRRVFLKHTTPPAKARTRGDYQLTPLLLSEPDMAWIQCTICTNHFVQQNAYFTRSSCPRCERHSKLYGYAWPKTDRVGPADKEERVLDHRTIHRFLDPNDERRARGRKLLQQQHETRDSDESDVPARGRRIDRKSHKAVAAATAAAAATERQKAETSSDTSPAGVRRSGRMRRLSSRLSEAIGLYE